MWAEQEMLRLKKRVEETQYSDEARLEKLVACAAELSASKLEVELERERACIAALQAKMHEAKAECEALRHRARLERDVHSAELAEHNKILSERLKGAVYEVNDEDDDDMSHERNLLEERTIDLHHALRIMEGEDNVRGDLDAHLHPAL